MYLFQSIAGNGDSFVDRGIESEIVVLGLARSDGAHPVQVDDVFPVTLHERRRRELFGQLMQPLD